LDFYRTEVFRWKTVKNAIVEKIIDSFVSRLKEDEGFEISGPGVRLFGLNQEYLPEKYVFSLSRTV
jgi:hypothetical protein